MLVDQLDFDKGDGLIPAVIQDADTLQLLMLGYMNREALEQTLRDGLVTFWSRTKGRLWRKGESSGNLLHVVSVGPDCDADALLVTVRPAGPTCHTGSISCFENSGANASESGVIAELEATLRQRRKELPDGSYTAGLFRSGRSRIAQKVGEEGVEVVIAALQSDPQSVTSEAADLLYHLLVLLVDCGYGIEDVLDVLRSRRG